MKKKILENLVWPFWLPWKKSTRKTFLLIFLHIENPKISRNVSHAILCPMPFCLKTFVDFLQSECSTWITCLKWSLGIELLKLEMILKGLTNNSGVLNFFKSLFRNIFPVLSVWFLCWHFNTFGFCQRRAIWGRWNFWGGYHTGAGCRWAFWNWK